MAANDLVIAAIIDGAAGVGLTKAGTGTLILSGVNSYSGITTVNDAGVLGGSGTDPRRVTVQVPGATLARSASLTAILDRGNFTLASCSAFNVTLNGAAAGTGYDQLNVTGTINLGGATLHVNPLVTSVGDTFTIIQNDGTDRVVGAFAGLPEGAKFTVGTVKFTITYKGGDGNDVVLTRIA